MLRATYPDVVTGEEELLYIPPPFKAVFSVRITLFNTGDEDELYIPPPDVPEFLETVTSFKTGDEDLLSIPPPRPLVFSLMVTLVIVGVSIKIINTAAAETSLVSTNFQVG